jgi:hypothetical protein
MSDEAAKQSRHALDPISRVSEVLFGLIMVLSITGSLSVAEAGRSEIRTMLIAALGCNLAWGFIDGVFYVMASVAERGRGLDALHNVRSAADPRKAQRIIADALPPVIVSILTPAELETMRQRLKALPEPPQRVGPSKDDWKGAVAVFLLVFLSTFPVVSPYTFMHDTQLALRVSHAIAIVMLFMTGYTYGRITRYHPWATGVAMVVLGTTLVAITMALGG